MFFFFVNYILAGITGLSVPFMNTSDKTGLDRPSFQTLAVDILIEFID